MTEIDVSRQAWLVYGWGCWGRGDSVVNAAKRCREAGAASRALVVLAKVIGDDKPDVDSGGMLVRDAGSLVVHCGRHKLSWLLKQEEV